MGRGADTRRIFRGPTTRILRLRAATATRVPAELTRVAVREHRHGHYAHRGARASPGWHPYLTPTSPGFGGSQRTSESGQLSRWRSGSGPPPAAVSGRSAGYGCCTLCTMASAWSAPGPTPSADALRPAGRCARTGVPLLVVPSPSCPKLLSPRPGRGPWRSARRSRCSRGADGPYPPGDDLTAPEGPRTTRTRHGRPAGAGARLPSGSSSAPLRRLRMARPVRLTGRIPPPRHVGRSRVSWERAGRVVVPSCALSHPGRAGSARAGSRSGGAARSAGNRPRQGAAPRRLCSRPG
jgi:hypothetical protein